MKAYVASELHWIVISGTEEWIESIDFEPLETIGRSELPIRPKVGAVAEGAKQVEQYIRSERTTFDLPIKPAGTPFQQSVWNELRRIEYGITVSYLDIARAIGNPKGVRAVGQAIGRNPISIVVPCHRVIGSGGKLTGYAGGMWRKEWLLALERGMSNKS